MMATLTKSLMERPSSKWMENSASQNVYPMDSTNLCRILDLIGLSWIVSQVWKMAPICCGSKLRIHMWAKWPNWLMLFGEKFPMPNWCTTTAPVLIGPWNWGMYDLHVLGEGEINFTIKNYIYCFLFIFIKAASFWWVERHESSKKSQQIWSRSFDGWSLWPNWIS